MKSRIIVGVPAYNEEIAIGSIVLRSLKYADEVVVVDDCSRDKTGEIARMAGAVVITHDTNQGKGACIRDIFSYAKLIDPDVLILMDGDGQHDPDELPLLIKPILGCEADMVIGSRFLEKGRNNVPKYRRVGQEVLTAATNVASGIKNTDSQSGFRAFSRNTFNCFSFGEENMGIESDMLVDAAKSSLNIKEVQVDIRYDVDCSTLDPVTHGFKVLNTNVKLIAHNRPMLFYGGSGSILFTIGIFDSLIAMGIFSDIPNIIINGSAGMICLVSGGLSIFTGIAMSRRWKT